MDETISWLIPLKRHYPAEKRDITEYQHIDHKGYGQQQQRFLISQLFAEVRIFKHLIAPPTLHIPYFPYQRAWETIFAKGNRG